MGLFSFIKNDGKKLGIGDDKAPADLRRQPAKIYPGQVLRIPDPAEA
ncbi:hypothetical protein AB3G45_26025 [Shinella sp. S4-D37]